MGGRGCSEVNAAPFTFTFPIPVAAWIDPLGAVVPALLSRVDPGCFGPRFGGCFGARFGGCPGGCRVRRASMRNRLLLLLPCFPWIILSRPKHRTRIQFFAVGHDPVIIRQSISRCKRWRRIAGVRGVAVALIGHQNTEVFLLRQMEFGGGILRLPLSASSGLRFSSLLLRFGLLPTALLLKPPFQWLLAGLALLLLLGEYRRRSAPFVALEVQDRAHCWLLDAAGHRLPARLLPGSCLHPRLTTLYLRYAGGLHTVFLPPAPGAVALHRRLRVRLGLSVSAAAAAALVIDPPGQPKLAHGTGHGVSLGPLRVSRGRLQTSGFCQPGHDQAR